MYECASVFVPGSKHQYQKHNCQDYACLEKINFQGRDYIIGAVADGLGSKTHSRKGAEIAVHNAISAIINYIESERDLQDHKTIKVKVVETVRSKIQEESENNNIDYDNYDCTLLSFYLSDDELMAIQIGDGFIVLKEIHGNYELLFQPYKGEFVNETIPITFPNLNKNDCYSCYRQGNFEFVCLATDGLERLALKRQKREYTAHTPAFKHIHELKKGEQEEWKSNIKCFLEDPEVDKRSDDDKTLLICISTVDERNNTTVKSNNFFNATANISDEKISINGKLNQHKIQINNDRYWLLKNLIIALLAFVFGFIILPILVLLVLSIFN